MGFFEVADGWEGNAPLPKTCHIYPTIMKPGRVTPYIKKIKKIYKSRGTFFHPKLAAFIILKNTDIDCILIHNLTF